MFNLFLFLLLFFFFFFFSLGKLGCSHYPTGSLLKVICSKDSIVYNAKVLESKIVGESIYYLVHYSGWNVRYDEWIGEDCITECVLIGDGKPLQKSPKRVYPALSPKLHETGHQVGLLNEKALWLVILVNSIIIIL